VERAVNKLKQFRAVATRFDKREYMYLATVDVATIKIWLRDLARTDPQDTAYATYGVALFAVGLHASDPPAGTGRRWAMVDFMEPSGFPWWVRHGGSRW
jgi:hypothetical protein